MNPVKAYVHLGDAAKGGVVVSIVIRADYK